MKGTSEKPFAINFYIQSTNIGILQLKLPIKILYLNIQQVIHLQRSDEKDTRVSQNPTSNYVLIGESMKRSKQHTLTTMYIVFLPKFTERTNLGLLQFKRWIAYLTLMIKP